MREALSMWTVFDHPKDRPTMFVARRFEISSGAVTPTEDMIEAPDLSCLREVLAIRGLACIERHPEDAPHIIEVWL